MLPEAEYAALDAECAAGAERICQTLLAPPPSDTLAAMTAMRTEFMQNKLPGLLEGLPPQRARKVTSEVNAMLHQFISAAQARKSMSRAPHRPRGSDLALWQSRTVLAALRRAAPAAGWHSDITVITTRGDVDPSPYLAGSVEKGFFTRELEVALLERRIDLVVHSLKDLPTAEPAGLREPHHPAARHARPTGC